MNNKLLNINSKRYLNPKFEKTIKIIEFFKNYKNLEKNYFYALNANEQYMLNSYKLDSINIDNIKNSKDLLKNLLILNKILDNYSSNKNKNKKLVKSNKFKLNIEISSSDISNNSSSSFNVKNKNNSYSSNNISIDNIYDAQASKLFNEIEPIFHTSQLITINCDLVTFINIMKNIKKLIENIEILNIIIERLGLFNILWLPDNDNILNYDHDVLYNSKVANDLIDLHTKSSNMFNIYVLNWVINIDKLFNRLVKLTNDFIDEMDEIDIINDSGSGDGDIDNCPFDYDLYWKNLQQPNALKTFCNYYYTKISELGRFSIIELNEFLKNRKNSSFYKTNFEDYIISNSNLMLKLSNNKVFMLNRDKDTNNENRYTHNSKNFQNKPSYRVVGVNTEPFIFMSEIDYYQINHTSTLKNECQDGIPCLEIEYYKNFHKISPINSNFKLLNQINNIINREHLIKLIRGFDNAFSYKSKYFINNFNKIHKKCCTGYIVNLLQKLSNDLNIDFELYIFPKEDYGKYDNKSQLWSGAINHLISDVAHLIVGPFSMTEERAQYVDFTTPFLYSGYSLLIKQDYNTYDVFMFMKPFTYLHWALIIMFAFISASSLAWLEFNSPFGLNPKGRQRARNYTLGSAISMVVSLMFMHTMPAKSPKSWAGKWVINIFFVYYFLRLFLIIKNKINLKSQNFIAGFALFFIATYTAQMASILSLGHENKVFNGFEDNYVSKELELMFRSIDSIKIIRF